MYFVYTFKDSAAIVYLMYCSLKVCIEVSPYCSAKINKYNTQHVVMLSKYKPYFLKFMNCEIYELWN